MNTEPLTQRSPCEDWSEQLRHHLGRREPGTRSCTRASSGRHRARHPAECRLVLLARQPPAGDGRGRLGEVRRLRPPADRLGEGPRHPDPLVSISGSTNRASSAGSRATSRRGSPTTTRAPSGISRPSRSARRPTIRRRSRSRCSPCRCASTPGRARFASSRSVAPARRSSPARPPAGASSPSRSARSYVDVAVKRWQTATGKTATLDGDGRTSTRSPASGCERVPECAKRSRRGSWRVHTPRHGFESRLRTTRSNPAACRWSRRSPTSRSASGWRCDADRWSSLCSACSVLVGELWRSAAIFTVVSIGKIIRPAPAFRSDANDCRTAMTAGLRRAALTAT